MSAKAPVSKERGDLSIPLVGRWSPGGRRIVNADILLRKVDRFVLWRPADTSPPPALVIGQLQLGAPVALVSEQLAPSENAPSISLFDVQVMISWRASGRSRSVVLTTTRIGSVAAQ